MQNAFLNSMISWSFENAQLKSSLYLEQTSHIFLKFMLLFLIMYPTAYLVGCVIQKRFLPIKWDGIVKLLRAEAATRTWCNLGKTSQSKWLNESPNRNLKKKYYVFEFFEWCLTSNLSVTHTFLLYNYMIILKVRKSTLL